MVSAHPSQPAAAVTLCTSCARGVLRAEDARDPGRHTATGRRGWPAAASHGPGKDNSIHVYLLDGNTRASPRLWAFLWQAQPLSKPEGHVASYTYELARISRVQSERVQQEAWLRPQIPSQWDQTDQDRARPAAWTLRALGLLSHASGLRERW